MTDDERGGARAPLVDVRWAGPAVVVAVRGEVDSSNADVVAGAVSRAFAMTSGQVVIDLEGVEFLGSAGLTVLAVMRHERGDGLAVVATSRVVRRPIELAGLDGVLPLYPSVRAAIAAMSPADDD